MLSHFVLIPKGCLPTMAKLTFYERAAVLLAAAVAKTVLETPKATLPGESLDSS
jgi:hypothetical protein